VERMASGERVTPFLDDAQAREETHGLSD
jgi:hypothetical protein